MGLLPWARMAASYLSGEVGVQDCQGHSLFPDPPSWSQEAPGFFPCSQNIPFARGVSEFSTLGPWACLNKSLPRLPPTPLPYPYCPGAGATPSFLCCLGSWRGGALLSGQMAMPHTQDSRSGEPGSLTLEQNF